MQEQEQILLPPIDEIIKNISHFDTEQLQTYIAAHQKKLLGSNLATHWSSEDLAAYYAQRPDTDQEKRAASKRLEQFKKGCCTDFFDDLQISRLKDKDFPYPENSFIEIKQLSKLASCINPEKTELEHYIQHLAILLYNSFQSAQIKDIDSICHEIAQQLFESIEHLDAFNSVETWSISIGEIRYEILAWISIFVRQEMFKPNFEIEDSDIYITKLFNFYQAFLNIHLNEKTYTGLPSSWTIFKEAVLQEKKIWQGINHPQSSIKLENFKVYLARPQHSPIILSQIYKYLILGLQTPEAKHSNFSYTLIVLLETMKEQAHVLFKQDLLHFAQFQLTSSMPLAIQIAKAAENNVHLAGQICLKNHYLAPSAAIFYCMYQNYPEKTQKLLEQYALHKPQAFKETIEHIFSNPSFHQEHKKLLEDKIHPLINEQYYPIYLLEHIYQKDEHLYSEEELIQLWLNLLDSGVFRHGLFLQTQEHQIQFAKLESLANKIIDHPLSHQQIHQLCLALSFYRASQLNQLFYFSANAETHWTEKLALNLLYKIAYPDGDDKQMNFDSIVQFIGLEFNEIDNRGIDEDHLSSIIFQDTLDFMVQHQQIDFQHQQKLLHLFGKLYFMHREEKYLPIPAYVFFQTCMKQLPSLAISISNLVILQEYIHLPAWLEPELSQTLATVFIQQHLQSMMHLDFEAQQKLIYASHYFGQQIYLAYCRTKLEQHANGDYKHILNNHQFFNDLIPDLKIIYNQVQHIEAYAYKYDQTCQQFPGILCYLAYLFGYNIYAAKAYLEDINKIMDFLTHEDIRYEEQLDALLNHVNHTIASGSFKFFYIFDSYYHTQTLALQNLLLSLKEKLHTHDASIPESSSIDDTQKPNSLSSSPSFFSISSQDAFTLDEEPSQYEPAACCMIS